jgi:hypothetical protein
MGNKGKKEGCQKTETQDKIPSGKPLGNMLKFGGDSPCTKGKKNKEWLNTIILPGPKN